MNTFGIRKVSAIAGLAVAAVVSMGAPMALAAPVPAGQGACDGPSSLSKCQTNGSVAIKAVPEARGSGNPDPSSRVGSQGRRNCYTQGADRGHICG